MAITLDGTNGITTETGTGDVSVGDDLIFTGTGNRITGDFTNSTIANRVMFQTSTANQPTRVAAIPNGTGGASAIAAINSSDPNNASFMQMSVVAAEAQLTSTVSGTGTYLPMTFYTGGSERMRVDTSGNVGIGTSSPSKTLDVNAASATFRIRDASGGNDFSVKSVAGPVSLAGSEANTAIGFMTNNTERMRIDTSGNVGIGTSSPSSLGKLVVSTGYIVANGGGTFDPEFRLSGASGSVTRNYAMGTDNLQRLYWYDYTAAAYRMLITSGGEVYIAGTTDQGAYNLQCNGTGVWGAGAYVNGSDERIKDDIAPIESGLDVVEKLNPVTYRYKESWSKDQSVQTGFIAQELLTALEGQNYVDGVVQQGGSEGYYSVAYQNIIPILTKAIQELKAITDTQAQTISALEARIAALETGE